MEVDTGLKGWLLLLLLWYKQGSKLWRAAAPLRQKRIWRVYINLKWRKNFISYSKIQSQNLICLFLLPIAPGSCSAVDHIYEGGQIQLLVWVLPPSLVNAKDEVATTSGNAEKLSKSTSLSVTNCYQIQQILAGCTLQTLTASRAWASLSLVEL